MRTIIRIQSLLMSVVVFFVLCVSPLATLAGDYENIVVSDVPVSYWRLNETNGTVAIDRMGANNGIYTGFGTGGGNNALGAAGPRPADGFDGFDADNYAPDGDGSISSMVAPDSLSLSITGTLTLEAWINPDDNTADEILSKYRYSGGYDYSWRLWRLADQRIGFSVSSDGTTWAKTVYSSAAALGEWTHVVAVFDPGSSIKLYINGVLSATEDTSATSLHDSGAYVGTAFYWGGPTYGEFNGRVDEMAVYDKALSPVEILAHFHKSSECNIALGREVLYEIEPNAPIDDGSPSVLTDGIKCAEDTTEYHNRVGYNTYDIAETVGINMCIDLQEMEILNKTSITINGHVRWGKPREITCVVSLDGTNFYTVATKQKLTSYGEATKPFAETYFSDTPNTWQTLAFDLAGIEARYVGLHIKGAGSIFYASEWEIDNDPDENRDDVLNSEIYSMERRSHFRLGHGLAPADDVFFGPRDDVAGDTLYVSDNILTPNFCYLRDRRLNGNDNPGAEDTAPLEFVINLPDSVEIIETGLMDTHNLTRSVEGNRNVYSFMIDPSANYSPWTRIHKVSHVGPFYFSTTNAIAGDEFAEFYCKNEYETYTARKVPITTITIPEVEEPLPFPVALTWMFEWHSMDWPGFFNAYKQMGFNSLPLSPRFYMTYDNNFAIREDVQALIAEARTNDMAIIYNESPLHMIYNNGVDNAEARCQDIPENLASWICPSYDGARYVTEMERIENISAIIQPDIFMADIEVFASGIAARSDCTRCQTGLSASGLSEEEYYTDQGTRIMNDVKQAARAGNTNAPVGLYNVWGGVYEEIFDFEKLYPGSIQLAQPSLYEAGRLEVYHQALTGTYDNTGGKNWAGFPWLTAGTYGEFPSRKLETMLYDCVLNGNSIGFYSFMEFDTALDYFYLAKALSNLSRYTGLLETGSPSVYLGHNNTSLFYSCFMTSDAALLHVGNYTSSQDEQVVLVSPIEGTVSILDVKTGQHVTPVEGGIEVTIGPQQSVLLSFQRNAGMYFILR